MSREKDTGAGIILFFLGCLFLPMAFSLVTSLRIMKFLQKSEDENMFAQLLLIHSCTTSEYLPLFYCLTEEPLW